MDKDLDAIIEEWLVEWKVPIRDKELLDQGNGPPTDVSKQQDKLKDSEDEENSQDGSSSLIPIK